MSESYSHLSANERNRIDELRNRDGLGVREITQHVQVEFVLHYGHPNTWDEQDNPTSYYFTTKDFKCGGEDKPGLNSN